MPGQNEKYIKVINTIGDLLLLNTAASASYLLKYGSFQGFLDSGSLTLLLYFNFAWITSASILNSYNIKRVTRITHIINNLIKQVVLFILVVEATLNITKNGFYSRSFLTYSYIFLTFLSASWRVGLTYLLKYYRSKGGNYKKVVIAGYGKGPIQLKKFFEMYPDNGYRFLGFFDDNPKNGHKVLGRVDDIERYVLKEEVHEIYCSPYELSAHQVTRLIDFSEENLIRLKFLPESNLIQARQMRIDFYDLLPIMILRPIPLDDLLNQFIKRVFDIVFSSAIIIFLLSWLVPLVAILIKLDSPGPVFFIQKRNGQGNQPFDCLKFRSMRLNEDAEVKQATKNDDRITRLGRFLRKSSIDELPQFFNVLVGDMSVVGPRPHPIKLNEDYRSLIDRYMSRHLIKPGVTGLAQVMGYRGETSEPHQMKGRIKMDIFYVEHWTFWLDIKIIFLTLFKTVKGDKNAY
ncbi:undecaprenyl-phosphate glucose phosphotransferase [Adhaeribacter aerolatus]|uniref:Undecaprenyl-phosphate glucose phosphotransferase n=1 Tax=Adhaeribacter aerolatus TaxID=670289 RepID=A0A512AY24_9BACT|nr:undecaprenyl-phosphate glucose phosphotransferase [Adhaeribacter aerolatus]GEO04618.1 undecaprenyl-phosphate glucose phosphotransferase [Adhaeribacter aerolatus]